MFSLRCIVFSHAEPSTQSFFAPATSVHCFGQRGESLLVMFNSPCKFSLRLIRECWMFFLLCINIQAQSELSQALSSTSELAFFIYLHVCPVFQKYIFVNYEAFGDTRFYYDDGKVSYGSCSLNVETAVSVRMWISEWYPEIVNELFVWH